MRKTGLCARALLGTVIGIATALVLSGCAGTAGTNQASTSTSPEPSVSAQIGKINVVTSTSVYGEIVKQIGGDEVVVSTLVRGTAQNPHEYEASASDLARVAEAHLAVTNGGGYDTFMDGLLADRDVQTLVAVDYASDDSNEHVWYDLSTMAKLADALAAKLSAMKPTAAEQFAQRAEGFKAELDEIAKRRDAIGAGKDINIFVTEPVPLFLTDAAGLKNLASDEFTEAVEEGQDVPPATLVEAIQLIKNKKISLVITNTQAGGAETIQVVAQANESGVPVAEMSENIPDGLSYAQWMQRNVENMEALLSENT